MSEPAQRSTTIVVGVDGFPQSNHALRSATHLAALSGAAVEVVTTWQYPDSYDFNYAITSSARGAVLMT